MHAHFFSKKNTGINVAIQIDKAIINSRSSVGTA
jgi:hypothetical protein